MAIPGQDGVDRAAAHLERLGPWMDEQGLPAVHSTGRARSRAGRRTSSCGSGAAARATCCAARRCTARQQQRGHAAGGARAGRAGRHRRAPSRLIAACTDERDVLGAVFYLMEPIDGFNPTLGLPEPHAPDAAMQRTRWARRWPTASPRSARSTTRPSASATSARPDGFLERQVARWRKQLDALRRARGLPGPEIPRRRRRRRAGSTRNRPADVRRRASCTATTTSPTCCSGPTRPDLAAIVDWEMCTIGDPLLDLGWLLATWPAGRHRRRRIGVDAPRPADAPTSVIAHYAARTDRDLSAIHWYRSSPASSSGIILEGTHARACAGQADKGSATCCTRPPSPSSPRPTPTCSPPRTVVNPPRRTPIRRSPVVNPPGWTPARRPARSARGRRDHRYTP